MSKPEGYPRRPTGIAFFDAALTDGALGSQSVSAESMAAASGATTQEKTSSETPNHLHPMNDKPLPDILPPIHADFPLPAELCRQLAILNWVDLTNLYSDLRRQRRAQKWQDMLDQAG